MGRDHCKLLQVCIAPLEAGFLLLPLTDVNDSREGEGAGGGVDAANTYFKGELRAIFAPTKKVSPRAHEPGLGVVEEPLYMLAVLVEVCWDEGF